MHQDYSELINKSFKEHGVDNPQLEKAISDILNSALDSRTLSRRIWKDIQENIERDQRVRRQFR